MEFAVGLLAKTGFGWGRPSGMDSVEAAFRRGRAGKESNTDCIVD